MKYCTKCGLELLDEELTCPQCKAKQNFDNGRKKLLSADLNNKKLLTPLEYQHIISIISILFTAIGISIYLHFNLTIGIIMMIMGLLFGIAGLILLKKRTLIVIISIASVFAVIASIIGILVLSKYTNDAIELESVIYNDSDEKYIKMYETKKVIGEAKGYLNKIDYAKIMIGQSEAYLKFLSENNTTS